MLQMIVIGSLAYLGYKIFLTSDPPKINGKYSQKGKWYTLKYWAFFVLFKLRQRQNKKKVTGGNAGYGVKSKNKIEDMEMVQKLPTEHPKVSVHV